MAVSTSIVRQQIEAAYPGAVELTRSPRAKTFSLPNGKTLGIYTISQLHYRDDLGQFQEINLARQVSDLAGYSALLNTTPYKLYISNRGARRFYPDRNRPEYIEVPAPAFLANRNGQWQAGQLVWNFPAFDVYLTPLNDRVKLLVVLKQPPPFDSISFEVSEVGARLLDYLTSLQYWDSSPEGAKNPKPLNVTYSSGVLTLGWDLTGMTFPVYIDPTFNVGTGGDDGQYTLTGSGFSSTGTGAAMGDFSGTGYAFFARFTSVNIPNASTIDTCTITVIADITQTGTICNVTLCFENADNPTAPTSAANAQGRTMTSGTAWSGIAAWAGGTQYVTPDFSAELQTVVNRAGWASGNAVIFNGRNNASSTSARRSSATYDNATYTEPILTTTWTEPGGGGVPLGSLSLLGVGR